VTGKRDGATGRGREYYLARLWMLPSFDIFLIIAWKHIYLKIVQNRLHTSARELLHLLVVNHLLGMLAVNHFCTFTTIIMVSSFLLALATN
jgi:hypothetical protein